jgi:hypothetical protein
LALGAVQVPGRLEIETVPWPVGTELTEYAPFEPVVAAASALAPDGVTVTLAPAIPPPRLDVIVPTIVPTDGVHVTLTETLTESLARRPLYDAATGTVQPEGRPLTATVPLPLCETSIPAMRYVPALVVVTAGSADDPTGVTTTVTPPSAPFVFETVPYRVPVPGVTPRSLVELQPATPSAMATM